jgi:hypothetical protein
MFNFAKAALKAPQAAREDARAYQTVNYLSALRRAPVSSGFREFPGGVTRRSVNGERVLAAFCAGAGCGAWRASSASSILGAIDHLLNRGGLEDDIGVSAGAKDGVDRAAGGVEGGTS